MSFEFFLKCMELLTDHFGRELNELAAEAYYEAIAPWLSAEEFKAACKRAIASARFFPTADELVSTIRGTVTDRATGQWEQVKLAAAGRVGIELDDAAKDAIAKLGGIATLGRLDESQLPWVKKEFIEAYKVAESRMQTTEHLRNQLESAHPELRMLTDGR